MSGSPTSQVVLVELVHVHSQGSAADVMDAFHVDMQQLLANPELAMETISNRAEQCLVDKSVTRLTYLDDEGDWCTLHKDTVHDAVQFAIALQPEAVGVEIRKLQLRVGTDARRLIPKLAAGCLRIVEESQQPALFVLIDLLLSLREGDLKAESVPSAIPQFVAAFAELSEDSVSSILARVREEAQKAVEELRQEQASEAQGQEAKEVEVHPHVICDGCEVSPLIGARWKSLTQNDFDLCEACFGEEERDPAAWARVKSQVRGSVVSSFYGPPEASLQAGGCNTVAVHGPALAAFEASEQKSSTTTTTTTHSKSEDQAEAAPESSQQEEKPAFKEELEATVAKEALRSLLSHPDDAVRAAAALALRSAQQGCDVQMTEEEQPGESDEDLDSEWAMADAKSLVSSEPDEAAAVSPLLNKPSAAVVSGAPLVLGVEAEDGGAQGDVTAEFGAVLAGAGAKQAFRLGRVALPTSDDPTKAVPICAKLVVVNDGAVAWPETTSVALVSGDAFGFPQMQLGALNPGEAAELIMDLSLPARPQPGAARSSWAILDASGTPLGPILLLEVFWTAQ
ncbi:unnamed protein product [Polarella glacialis]|uniref:ZZ-type domain-containing protein n=1 Tax=Polarella glacialis TaxID=89957 RepID=A0A813FBX5_POLGL|nr:unnamed protein product [Polarella glacialis]